jgi:hypothetical protein
VADRDQLHLGREGGVGIRAPTGHAEAAVGQDGVADAEGAGDVLGEVAPGDGRVVAGLTVLPGVGGLVVSAGLGPDPEAGDRDLAAGAEADVAGDGADEGHLDVVHGMKPP